MKKLFYIIIIALMIGCAKNECEEIVTNVELGVTYTAASEGIITVNNQSDCHVYVYFDNNQDNRLSDELTNTFNINTGQVYKIKQDGKWHSEYNNETGEQIIWQDTCIGNVTAFYKSTCND